MDRFTGDPGQWWNAPPNQIKHAYYRLLREVYQYPALDAWNQMKYALGAYPEFMRDPIGTLREAVRS